MQAADDVEFCYRLGPALARDSKGFLEGHRVSGGRVGLAAEGAEPATGHTHIRGVDVPVDVEVGPLPVPLLAHMVGKVTEGEQVAGFVERNTLVETETLARPNLFGDRVKFRVFYAERAWEHMVKIPLYRPNTRIATGRQLARTSHHDETIFGQWSEGRGFGVRSVAADCRFFTSQLAGRELCMPSESGEQARGTESGSPPRRTALQSCAQRAQAIQRPFLIWH